jgi:V/A-type H+-transporting ATPase subunit I
MQLATLFVLREDTAAAALALAQSGAFAPETSDIAGDDLPEMPVERYHELYQSAHARLEKLAAACPRDLLPGTPQPLQAVSEQRLAQIDDWLGSTWLACSRYQEALHHHAQEAQHYQTLLGSLETFARFGVDLGLLQRGGRFLDVRVGTVASEDVPRLKAALSLAGYVLEAYASENGKTECLIAGPRGREEELLPLLRSASWRAMEVPPELVGRPEDVRAHLTDELQKVAAREAEALAQLKTMQENYRAKLQEAAQVLYSAAPHAQIATLLRARGGLATVSGWVPRRSLDDLRGQLAATLGNRYLLSLRDPAPEEAGRVPSLTRHPRWLRPFVMLVRNYGVPRYGEIDPTLLFALSYVLMFGVMFGDVGHGAIIAAAGLWLRRLRFARPFLVAAGLSSMLFGWFYGSIFGFEEILRPLWIAPLSDPTRMLLVALYWGVGFIAVATLLTIVNRLGERRYREALLASKGVAGLLFYAGMLYAGQQLFRGACIGGMGALLLLAPLAAIVHHLWHEQHGPLGEKALVVGVEAFETALNYVANTLSFLRVAAFSLNHVALAVAVFALAHMMGTVGHWVALVLGNLFILILEGAIVAIQVLRLEYYEGFSRFYQGTGRPYRPLHLGTARSQVS